MRSVCFCVHLTSGDDISIIEHHLDPTDESEVFMERFSEAQKTGLLVTGEKDTHQFIIPFENIAFVERIPDFDEENDEMDDE